MGEEEERLEKAAIEKIPDGKFKSGALALGNFAREMLDSGSDSDADKDKDEKEEDENKPKEKPK